MEHFGGGIGAFTKDRHAYNKINKHDDRTNQVCPPVGRLEVAVAACSFVRTQVGRMIKEGQTVSSKARPEECKEAWTNATQSIDIFRIDFGFSRVPRWFDGCGGCGGCTHWQCTIAARPANIKYEQW